MRAGRGISAGGEKPDTPTAAQGRGSEEFCVKAAVIMSRSPSKMQQVRASWKAAEAQRKADKAAAEAQRKADIERATEVITAHLTETGEDAQAIQTILKSLPEKRLILDVCNGSQIHEDKMDVLINKAKQGFLQKLNECLKPWHFSDQQKAEVAKRLMKTHSVSEVARFAKQGYLASEQVEKAVVSALDDCCGHFQCPICMDPLVVVNCGSIDTSNNWFVRAHSTEHWHNHPCGHACCRSCITMWAETEINDQKLKVRCPAANCSYNLFDQDLRTLVSPEAFERYQERKGADYLHHLKSTVKSDPTLKLWLKGHARPCPDCHVIVSRSEGCDHMMCVCGTHFCYACGFKKCKCGSTKRRDIWNPRS